MLKAQEAFSEANRLAIQQRRDSIEAAELQRKKEELAKNKEITQEQLENVDYVPESLRKVDNVKKKFRKTRMVLGLGAHLLSSGANDLTINYFDGDGDQILALTGDIPEREFEVVGRWEFDIAFHKNLFTRFGWGFDFWRSTYRERSIGLGCQLNLAPRRRPLILRGVAQYSYLRYYRVLGEAKNNYGKFKVGRERFKGDEIRLSYGSRHHNLNLSGEFAIELNRNRELYFRGTYHYGFANQQDVWFKETKQFSRRDKRLPVSSSRLEVRQNDAPFSGRISPLESWSFTVGLLFK
jgi:hypothetical protein